MLPGQKEKLEKLINSSPILNSKERIEWWSLLDLMNDKQSNEFERILLSATAAPKTAPPPVQPQKVAPPIQQPKPEASPSAIPKLSHILNLPRVEAEGSEIKKDQPVPKIPNIQKPEEPKKSVFEQKLKSILEEKELGAPKPKEEKPAPQPSPIKIELEIKNAAPQPATVNPPKPMPVEAQPATSKVEIEKPALPETPEENSAAPAYKARLETPAEILKNNALAQKQDAKSEPIINPAALKLPVQPLSTLSTEKPKDAPAISSLKPDALKFLDKQPSAPDSSFSAGISFGNPSQKASQEILSSIKKYVEQHKPLSEQSPSALGAKSGPKRDINLASLADLNKITADMLQNADMNAVVSKIKNLIIQNGYYEVLFNIEKSPGYKSYIQTGARVLNNQGQFGVPSGLEKNLSQAEFETMADLLAKIQSD